MLFIHSLLPPLHCLNSLQAVVIQQFIIALRVHNLEEYITPNGVILKTVCQ